MIRERVTRVRAGLALRDNDRGSVAATLAEMAQAGGPRLVEHQDEATALRSALTNMLNRKDSDT